jgi:hypothetical protein
MRASKHWMKSDNERRVTYYPVDVSYRVRHRPVHGDIRLELTRTSADRYSTVLMSPTEAIDLAISLIRAASVGVEA